MKPRLAALITQARRGSRARGSRTGPRPAERPNLNPFRGRRTVGAPPGLVTAIARRVLRLATVPATDTRPGHEGELVVGWRGFPEGLGRVLDGGWALTRPDGVSVPFLVYVSADPEGYWVSGGVGTVRTTGQAVVGLFVPTKKSYDEDLWMEELERFFAHELAHLADPGSKRGRNDVPTSTMADVWQPKTEAQWRAYVNDPREIVARRHEVWHELSAKKSLHDVVRRWTKTTDWTRGRMVRNVLRSSETWRDIEGRLTPANRRKIQTMAAELVESWLEKS